jgi:hypothetical protein
MGGSSYMGIQQGVGGNVFEGEKSGFGSDVVRTAPESPRPVVSRMKRNAAYGQA